MKLTILVTSGLILAAAVYGQDKKGGEGVTIFNEQCVGCHGQDGHAQTEMGKKVNAADLTSPAVQQLSESDMVKTVKHGSKKMPAFDGKLSDDDIKSVVSYVRTLGKSQ